MTKKRTGRRFLKITFRVIVALFVVELVLRLAGTLMLIPTSKMNRIEAEDENKLRILALGESTTADYFSSQANGAWPRSLERDLSFQGINARVYNEALAGTTSALILGHLDDYLDLYRPQIVISMMGINDPPDLWIDDSALTRLKLNLSRIRLVKLANWVVNSVESQTHCRINYSKFDLHRYQSLIDRGLILSGTHSIAEVESEFKASGLSDNMIALGLAQIVAIYDHRQAGPKDRLAVTEDLANRAFEIAPLEHDVDFWALKTNSSKVCTNDSRVLLKCGNNLPDDLISAIATCSLTNKDLLRDPLFKSRGFSVAGETELPTKHHYQMLNERLTQKGIAHIAVQYPTLPLARLQEYFEDEQGQLQRKFQNIVFVSNEENFANALATHPYQDVFRDRFRGSWGHTTVFGHKLIADSIAKGVKKLVDSGLQ